MRQGDSAIAPYSLAISAMPVLFRKPQRISITVSHHLYELLTQCSDLQGRSVSNLAAFLLESALDGVKCLQKNLVAEGVLPGQKLISY
jgi:hypothetical protein